MAVRRATATWHGTLKEGNGNIKLGSGAYDGQYNFSSRFEEGVGTNPEELLGAAHAGCYSMKLNAMLHAKGMSPEHIKTVAHVTVEKINEVMTISKIVLEVEGKVAGMSQAEFEAAAHEAHDGCIISIALKAIPTIEVKATLV
jgi:osmotically inducible protein OsmC